MPLTSENIEELMDLLWGKSEYKVKGSRRWLPLLTHLHDTCDVGEIVWTRLMSRQNRTAVCRAGSMPPDQGFRIFQFLCGIHDVGKASTSFVHKSEWLHNRIRGAHTVVGDCRVDSTVVRHETVSHVALYWWLIGRLRGLGVAVDGDEGHDVRYRLSAWGVPVGGHHGNPPSKKDSGGSTRFTDDDGAEEAYVRGKSSPWEDVRNALIDDIATRCGIAEDDLRHMASNPLRDFGQNLLSAAVIVTDWIASNESLFAYGDGADDVVVSTPSRTDHGISKFGILDTWEPSSDMEDDFDATFQARFGDNHTSSFTPRPVQVAVHEHVKTHAPDDGAMFVIIEDATGSGKTEAGLAAAEMLAARSGARGVMVALPTMATSNAMFDRVQKWITRIGQNGTFSTNLLHSSSALDEEFTGIARYGMRDARDTDGELHCEAALTTVHRWMVGRHCGMTSDFNVGTIDSVISAGLKREYALMPHFGLSSKVLVIDEVHDSDEYMREFLCRTLMWLGRYGVPVVALSATLTPSVRERLHKAYLGVLDGKTSTFDTNCLGTKAYPLISSSTVDGAVKVTDSITTVERTKKISIVTDPASGKDPLVKHALRRVGSSGCAAVVCDTVRVAQDVYSELKLALPDWKVVLLHSRFTLADRTAIEKKIVSLLGKNGDRPEKMIVVGTQVLEQSLDIDFDVMITESAPTDQLIQRAGRLHRHIRENRSRHHPEPVMVITGVPTDTTVIPVIGTMESRVYGKARLIVTAAVLNGKTHLTTPHDTTSLVVDMFSARDIVPESWLSDFDAAVEREQSKANSLSTTAKAWLIPPTKPTYIGPLTGWELPDDGRTFVSVRAAVMDRSAVVLVRDSAGHLVFPDKMSTRVMEYDEQTQKPLPPHVVREVALLEVKLPKRLRGMPLKRVDELEKEGYIARWDTCRSRYVDSRTLVLILNENLETTYDGISVRYSSDSGLMWGKVV